MDLTVKWPMLLAVQGVLLCQAALPLPPYIKPCARSDPAFKECALEHARDVFPRMIKGDRKYQIPPLDPLDIQELILADGGSRTVALKLVLRDGKVYGLKDAQIERTEYDFEKQHITHEVRTPRIVVTGQYTVSGRILLLPIAGSGDVNVTLVNCTITYDEDYTFRHIDGLRHLQPQNPKTTLQITRMYMNLANLFGGDPLLNKQMNEFLNENWREVFNEFYSSLVLLLTEFVGKIFSGFDKLVPFDVVFPEILPE